jgi:peptide/nickel transport system substrate-binding protein
VSVLLIVLILSACGQAPAGQPSVTASAAATAQTPLVVAITTEPTTFDANFVASGLRNQTLASITEALVMVDTTTGQLRPALAETWQLTSPLTWRFTLRKGVSFSNGEPFNAQAVVKNVQRILLPATKSELLTQLGGISEAKAVDDLTVDITTKTPAPLLPRQVFYLRIQAPGWMTDHASELPNLTYGTGPYVLAEFTRGKQAILKANASYWGQQPAIKEVKVVWRADAPGRAAMVSAGEADLAQDLTSELSAGIPQILRTGTSSVLYARINTKNPLLADVRVRQAIAYAVDYESIIKNLYSGFARSVSGPQIIVPTVTGYNAGLKSYTYDPTKARSLLQQAGAVGKPLTISSRSGSFAHDAEFAQALTGMLSNVGFAAQLQIVDEQTRRDLLYTPQPSQGLVLGLHDNDIGDSSKSLDSFLTCGAILSLYCNATVDGFIVAGDKLADPALRADQFSQAWKIVWDEVPVLGFLNPEVLYAASARVVWRPRTDLLFYFQEMTTK